METPVEALRRRRFGNRPSSSPATTPNSIKYPGFLNQVLLHDWWLIWADSDSHGKGLGIGGFTSKVGTRAIRCFYSAPIVKRQDAVTLKTNDGLTVMVLGYLDIPRTLENGFSNEICDRFLAGFPYDWAEYAGLSLSEERSHFSGTKGVSCSDVCKAPSPGDHPADALNGNIHSKQNKASSAKKEEKTKACKKRRDEGDTEHGKCSGPLTRSRARLLGN